MAYGYYLDSTTSTYVYKYLAGGTGGRLYNADAIGTWTSVTSPVTANLNAAEFVPTSSKFIAVGSGGKIVTSSDTQTWTEGTSVTTENLNAIAVGGSTVVAVGNNGSIVTTTDAITWKLATSVPSGTPHLYGVIYSPAGKWVAVGAAGVSDATEGIRLLDAGTAAGVVAGVGAVSAERWQVRAGERGPGRGSGRKARAPAGRCRRHRSERHPREVSWKRGRGPHVRWTTARAGWCPEALR